MKQAFAFLLLVSLLILSACGSKHSPETTTVSDSVSQTQVPQVEVNKGKPANSTLGNISSYDGASVEDASVLYRTRDSYSLENLALDAAKADLMQTLSMPQTLLVRRYTVWDCADDGDCVYYVVHIDASYVVESGERLSAGYFCDIGIDKSTQQPFDASDRIDEVTEKYSLFLSECTQDQKALDESDPIRAAEKIALSRLKYPDQGKVVSSQIVEEESDYLQIEVLCSGLNDYEMQIPCVYTVYLTRNNGSLFEISAGE